MGLVPRIGTNYTVVVITVQGTLVRRLRHRGSKSEHLGFAVRTEDGNEVIVEKRGDNPVHPRELESLTQQRVRAVGQMYRGRLLADSVDRID